MIATGAVGAEGGMAEERPLTIRQVPPFGIVHGPFARAGAIWAAIPFWPGMVLASPRVCLARPPGTALSGIPYRWTDGAARPRSNRIPARTRPSPAIAAIPR